jgi:hypothetical protein
MGMEKFDTHLSLVGVHSREEMVVEDMVQELGWLVSMVWHQQRRAQHL